LIYLSGKASVITGAGRGIGAATALYFAEAGAELVLTDLDADALHATCEAAREIGATVVGVVGDVAVEAHADEAIRACVEAFGRIDVLVANAGIVVPGTVLEITADEWDRIHSVDGRGMFLFC